MKAAIISKKTSINGNIEVASTKSDLPAKSKVHDLKDMVCGYVMPISDTTEYRGGHWEDVKSMLDEVTLAIGFKESRIVSTGLDVSTIHKRIVNNIYNDDIIICDVSSRNPNVMFELGMRIAFDKPVDIINHSNRFIKERFPKHLFGNNDEEVVSKINTFTGVIIENMDDEFVYIKAKSPESFHKLVQSI